VQLIKNGGSAAQKNDATSATHLAGGHYKVPLNTTDTGTLGRLRLYVNESGALPVWRDFMVVPANVFDSLVGGADYLEVDAVAISGDTTAADNLEKAADGTGYNLGGGSVVAASVTAAVSANVTQISGDSTAADNLEADYDGTGFTKAASTVGTVTAITNEVTANVTKIGGSAATREKLAHISNFVTYGTVGATSLTTTTCSTNLTEATNDHYNGLLIRFLTGNLAGQGSLVTDYNGTTKVLTFSALTDTPAEGGTFILV
jgi:hypothetical protein